MLPDWLRPFWMTSGIWSTKAVMTPEPRTKPRKMGTNLNRKYTMPPPQTHQSMRSYFSLSARRSAWWAKKVFTIGAAMSQICATTAMGTARASVVS